MKVLITGGAGFIGTRLAKRLAFEGADVTVFDNLSSQIHANTTRFPSDLASVAHCVRGDVCIRHELIDVVQDQNVIVHLAAETGTGQSMHAIERYEQVNIHGTAVLLDILVDLRPRSLRKLIVASSRAIYGEGQYHCSVHGDVHPAMRTKEALSAGRFEPNCPTCLGQICPVKTPETAPLAPASFYGITKQVQEQMILMFARTLGLDGIALRYQNVYGPGQSLKNPYTGLLAVFSNLARQNKPLNVFEDGLESRDFVYIDDVVEATVLCMVPTLSGLHSLNVGSGHRTSVLEVARLIVAQLDANVPIQVSGAFRIGDIRHNTADISKIVSLTGFQPKWSFADGLQQFLSWAQTHDASDIGFERSMAELAQHGLLGKPGREEQKA